MHIQSSSQKDFMVVNIGNSTVDVGVFNEGGLRASWSVATGSYSTCDEALVCLRSLFMSCELSFSIEGGIVSSVVPECSDAWISATTKIAGLKPFIVGPGIKTGIRMKYNDPAELGADRIAHLAAAQKLCETPVVVVNFGTATTIDVIDQEGYFIGGVIAPGLRLAARAISQEAAQLSSIDLRIPRSVIGKNTRDAIRSGLVKGEAARVDGLIDAIWDELGCQTQVAATGSDANIISLTSCRISCIHEGMILEGLACLYALNVRSR